MTVFFPEPIDSFSGKYDFLSNFFPCTVLLEGLYCPTVEHAYQAAKTHDGKERLRIARLESPGKAKRAGQYVDLRSDWEQVKVGVMAGLPRQKFGYPYLGDLLLATSGIELVEGNTWGDKYWGVCDGEGQNHLGKLLMTIRDELAAKRNG